MKKDLNGYDIFNDYEGLCGQLTVIIEVIEMTEMDTDLETIKPLITVSNYALKQLIREHRELADKYREELKQ